MTMRNRFITLTFAVAIAALLASTATVRAFDLSKMLGNPDQDESLDTFKLIHVKDLAGAIADPKSGVMVYDANHPDTRAQYGIIPGAHLLPSADGANFLPTRMPSWSSTAPIRIEWRRMKPPGGRSKRATRTSA
jgi:hypothetical protein